MPRELTGNNRRRSSHRRKLPIRSVILRTHGALSDNISSYRK
jgi:hypothetical protein